MTIFAHSAVHTVRDLASFEKKLMAKSARGRKASLTRISCEKIEMNEAGLQGRWALSDPMITSERLDEIERGLVGVTPGPWRIEGCIYKHTCAELVGDGKGLAPFWIKPNGWGDITHIARMDPQTVAELVRLARIGMEREAAIKALGESNG